MITVGTTVRPDGARPLTSPAGARTVIVIVTSPTSREPALMRRLVLALTALAALALGTAGPAAAITFGSPDGNGHPNVGGLLADQAYSDGTWTYCSGTLVSPTVFLTAAHCDEGGTGRVRITFSSAYKVGDKTYAGTFHGDPAYPGPTSDPHDIAVVVLDKAVTGITPARLPAAGSLDKLSATQRFTSVGYGAYEVTNGPGGHQYVYNDVRGVATGTLNATNKNWLRISMNPAKGDGGTCFGDSGGPNFLGTSNVVAATTITGDSVCRSTNVDYRLDTPAARSFLAAYVTLP
jgi:V8-like Glu-specific endopeptidase